MHKVLLVEDDQDQINHAKEEIGDLCNLTYVETYKEAVEVIDNHKYDIIISDLEIPYQVNWKPDFKNGLAFFLKYSKEVSAYAIVSNYEHHIYWRVSSQELTDDLFLWQVLVLRQHPIDLF